jgi:integrase
MQSDLVLPPDTQGRHGRRSCARLCHLARGDLGQIQFLLGHVSIQTTEHYLGCKQKLRCAVNDRTGIEPKEQ